MGGGDQIRFPVAIDIPDGKIVIKSGLGEPFIPGLPLSHSFGAKLLIPDKKAMVVIGGCDDIRQAIAVKINRLGPPEASFCRKLFRTWETAFPVAIVNMHPVEIGGRNDIRGAVPVNIGDLHAPVGIPGQHRAG